MKRLNGVITIYLSLTLLIVMSLICTVIEDGRITAIKAKADSVTYMGLDSVFSEYAEPVFEKYGVMMLWLGKDNFESKLDDYISANLNVKDLDGISGLDVVSLNSSKKPTDDNGEVFAEQVRDYMDYYLLDDVAENILSNASTFKQSDALSEFAQKVNDHSDAFKDVEDKASKVNDAIEETRKEDNPKELLDKMADSLESYTNGSESAKDDFENNLSKLKSSKSNISNGLGKIETATNEYYESVETAKEAVSDIENDLSLDSGDYDPDVYSALKSEIDEIKSQSADLDADYYGVVKNDSATKEYKEKIDSLDKMFDICQKELGENNADAYKVLVNTYQKDFDGFDLNSLKVTLTENSTEKADTSILTSVSDFFSNGILSIVAKDISEKSIETSELPSKTCSEKTEGSSSSNIASSGIDKAIFGEYQLTHFGCYSEKQDDSALDYEIEYCLSGKASDKANLESVVNRIVLIRNGFNLISLLKDSEKKAEADAIGAAIATSLYLPALSKVFGLLVCEAWALAEGIADVKALLAGKKVETIKDGNEWTISLNSLANFSSSDIADEGGGSGLGYKDYLRILLLMSDESDQYFKTMDMIQANMCKNENSNFRVADCLTSAEVNATFSAPQMFISLPFVKNYLSKNSSGYKLEVSLNYAY